MKVTSEEFERFMTRLDNDSTVDEKELSLILKKMKDSKNWKGFNDFLESIAVDKDGKPVSNKNKKKKVKEQKECNMKG